MTRLPHRPVDGLVLQDAQDACREIRVATNEMVIMSRMLLCIKPRTKKVISRMPKPEINEKNTKLVPVIAMKVLDEYIKEPFGSGSFKMSRSLSRNTYILKYIMASGKVVGSAELVSFNDEITTYILLFSSNISGSKEPFTMLFQEIAGKILPKECDLPFFEMFNPLLKGRDLKAV